MHQTLSYKQRYLIYFKIDNSMLKNRFEIIHGLWNSEDFLIFKILIIFLYFPSKHLTYTVVQFLLWYEY